MEKKLNKPYSRNVRLDKPCGLLGVPPDTPTPGAMHNVVVVARLTDSQYTTLINCFRSSDSYLPQ